MNRPARPRLLSVTHRPLVLSFIATAILISALLVLAAMIAGTLDRASATSSPRGGMLPVPVVTIYPGDTITPEAIGEKHFYFDPGRPLPVIDDAALAVGKVARRTLPAGKPIPHNAFGEPDLVHKGKPTQARYIVGGLYMSTAVLPLQSGPLHAVVQARNIDTGRIITGLVSSDGTLAVLVGGNGARTAATGTARR